MSEHEAVWAVLYSCGDYDDHYTWPVCWYPSEADADAHCVRFNNALAEFDRLYMASPRYDFTSDFAGERFERESATYWAPHQALLEQLAALTGHGPYPDSLKAFHTARVRQLPRGS